jgi:hypothetical protein
VGEKKRIVGKISTIVRIKKRTGRIKNRIVGKIFLVVGKKKRIVKMILTIVGMKNSFLFFIVSL